MSDDSIARAWNEVSKQVSRAGVPSLTQAQARFYWVNRFLTDFDMGGLSGFLYNASPDANRPTDWAGLDGLIEGLTEVGADDLRRVLADIRELVVALPEARGQAWSAFVQPAASRLSDLEPTVQELAEPLWDLLDSMAKDAMAQ